MIELNWSNYGILIKLSGKFGNMSFKNIYKGKKVLITGHTGFKGSWLSIWLNELGANVYGYALAPVSDQDNFVRCGLRNVVNHKIGDVRDLKELKEYFDEVQPDFAFHLAAQPLVIYSYEDPVGTFDTNILGTVNFWEAVRSTPSVKAAINVTTDKCYDNKEWVYGYREVDPMGGKDPYSASKGCSELITSSYMHSFFSHENTCNIASVRAGNVIGGGDWSENRILPDFFRALKANSKMELRNPEATRPWQHVLEPLSGYLLLAVKLFEEGGDFEGAWNFGPEDPQNYSVIKLVQELSKHSKEENYFVPVGSPKYSEANLLKLDISKAVTKLKWRTVLNFEETVEFTYWGYDDDLNMSDLYKARCKQIELYTIMAMKKNIEWAL